MKGTLGDLSFMIGSEENEDFSEQELEEFILEEHATRSRGDAIIDNDKMKVLWKDHFNIDIDRIDVDFSKFNLHLQPNLSSNDEFVYFELVPDGVFEWILGPINHPTEDWVYYDAVSCLMESVAYIINMKGQNLNNGEP
ncbi:MAG: hypothetical protein KBT06_02295 [Prevotellaceae bacterium]|nr:hypothetical protein [Candidatus Colivivens equi]